MALTRYMMQRLITEDGHLKLEGKETEQDLRYALYNLYCHTWRECRSPFPPERMIGEILPNVDALSPTSTYRHPRKSRKKTEDVELPE